MRWEVLLWVEPEMAWYWLWRTWTVDSCDASSARQLTLQTRQTHRKACQTNSKMKLTKNEGKGTTSAERFASAAFATAWAWWPLTLKL